MDRSKRITVFVGNYGSGKTEISLAYALEISKNNKVTLVDLDIVNPYFRSGEKKEWLESKGIRVLMPNFANTAVDVPSLPADIQRVFDQKDEFEHIIFDVGGDDTGAAALGRYFPYFQKEIEQVQVLYVLNTLRPLSGNKDDIIDLMNRIESRSRLQINAIIHNTNLADETDMNDILSGYGIAENVAAEKKIPITENVVTEELYGKLPQPLKENSWVIKRRMKPDWME